MPQWLWSILRFITVKLRRRTGSDKYDALCALVNLNKIEDWRKGQTLMIALYKIDRKLYGRITDSAADCFYDDARIPAFDALVKKEWGVE